MKLSRRAFVHTGCAAGMVTLVPDSVEAWIHGAAISAANNNRITINPPMNTINLAKGFGFTAQDPTTVDSNGYPTSTPVSAIGSNPSMPAAYYGTFTFSWGGTAAMFIGSSPPMVIASGGAAIFEMASAGSGDLGVGNKTICGPSLPGGVTNPSIVFAFGWNIQSIDSNAGVIRINTKTNFVASGSGYTPIENKVNITGANANTGANGTWSITNLTASSFDLVGSVFTNAQVGAAGQAIFAAGNLSISIRNSGTFSGFTNLVWCRTADVAKVAAGQIIDDTVVSQLQYLMNHASASMASRGWLRFMDNVGVQSSFECDFSQRIPVTSINYSATTNFRSGYWAAAITNGGSDSYTCSDPSVSVWNGSTYIDNAIVQGTPSATNTAGQPTLAVGGHPAKPIYDINDGIPPFHLKLSAAPPSPGTDVMVFTLSATWLNGGTPYVFTYNTVAGDTSVSALSGNLDIKLGLDAILAAGLVFHGNPQGNGPFLYPRTAQAGRMTVTYTSGPAICTITTMSPSTIQSGSKGTFIYNYLIDGWIYRDGGMTCSIPFEAIIELCNRTGSHCWLCWGTTKIQYVTDVSNFFGDAVTGLTSGLRLGNEAYNEVWNSSAFPFSLLQTWGKCFGLTDSSFASNLSYTALRTIQYAALGKAAWIGKGRSVSDYYVMAMSQIGENAINGNFDTNQLKSTKLSSANTIYSTYGGLNGGTSPDYTAAGSRAVDITTVIGLAPYWNSKWLGSGSFTSASQFTGTATQNAPPLQAALDFANGLTSTAFASMANQFARITVRSGGSTGGQDWVDMQTFFTDKEAQAAQYDSFRTGAGIAKLGIIHYEGGPSFGQGANGNSGVNSPTFNTVLATDITALANRFTALDTGPGNFNVSPYTSSGTDDKTEMATMLLTMLQAWKFDVDRTGAAAGTGSDKNMIKTYYYQALKNTSGANREAKGAQYGYAQSNWGYCPGQLFANNFYQNYDATHEFNA